MNKLKEHQTIKEPQSKHQDQINVATEAHILIITNINSRNGL